MFNLVPMKELELITKELVELKEECAALVQENAALLEKISALQEEISQLLEKKEAEIDQLNKENQELRDNLSVLQRNVGELQNSISVLQEQNTALVNEKKTLAQNLSNAETKIATLTRENNKLIKSLATATDQVKNLEGSNDALKTQMKSLQEVTEKYRIKINESSAMEDKLVKEYTASVESLKTDHAKTVDKLKSEIYGYQQQLEEKEVQFNDLDNQRKQEISKLRSAVHENARQLSLERGILVSAQKRFDREKEELRDALSTEKFNLKTRLNDSLKENQELRNLIKEYSNKLSNQSLQNNPIPVPKENSLEYDSSASIGSDAKRFMEICREISRLVGIPNIIEIAEKLVDQHYYTSNNMNFNKFIEMIIKNDKYFVRADSLYHTCYNTLIVGLLSNKSDKEIVDNSVKSIKQYLSTLYKSQYQNYSDEIDQDNSSDEANKRIDLDLETTDIKPKQKEIIYKFRNICKILSRMYLLLPHMKYLDKLAYQSIDLYNSGNKEISFYAFVSVRSMEKKYSPAIKGTMVDILDLINERKEIIDIIKIIEKRNRITSDKEKDIPKNIIKIKDRQNYHTYNVIYPANFYQKSEMQLNNNKLIIHGEKLYLNVLSRSAQLDKAYNGFIYISNNIYITLYKGKKGIIYIGKKAKTVYEPKFIDIIYNKGNNSFELTDSINKIKIVPMSKIKV